MSYNYDYNPWDENSPGGQQQAGGNYATSNASGGGGYATASGYTNPQYQDAWDDQQQQQQQAQYGGQEAAYSYGNEQQQQQQQPVEGEQKAPMEEDNEYQHKQASGGGESGLVGRFLRAHVPGCGACLDATQPLVDLLFKYVNRELLVSKIFYFFFYSAFGSLFPLMGVYFKQLGMNPAQVGIITGVRPFIEIFSAPFWNSLADRFQKGKVLLLFSLASWIIFTYSLAHIRPPASACVAFNDTDYVLYTPYSANDLSNYDVGQLESSGPSESSGELTTAAAASGNEVFMNKLPNREELEGKDEILVKEEQVNDQGRKRRKRNIGQMREQIERPRLSGYSTDGDGDDDDEGYESAAAAHNDDPLELDVDLENDFDDAPLGRSAATSAGSAAAAAAAFFDTPGEYQEGDEFEQQRQQVRVRRHLSGGGEDEDDDSAGESQEEEGENERIRSSKGRRREDDDEENNIQGGEREEAEDEERKQKGASIVPATSPPPSATQTHESIEGQQQQQQQQTTNKTKRIYKQRHKTPPTHIVGMSPITVEYAVNYNREKHGQFVTPMFSTIVYKLDDIKEVFFLLLLLITLGEFFSAPALTIADSLTLSFLGTNTDLYGRQRMFGSLGWAITLLLVGMALDNSTTIADHPCGPHQRERSYTVCFTIFSLLMACAFLTATQFTFKYPSSQQASKSGSGGGVVVTKTTDGSGDAVVTTTTDDLYASTRPREIFNTAPPVNAPPPGGSNSAPTKEKFEFLDKWKSAVFAQSTGQLPEWVNVFRQFKKSMHLTYLFITWFLGCGVGLVFTFLFWHLQDVGGTPTLFGICSVINHISEVLAYFFSSYFIKRYGHTKVLSVGLGCNVIRFLYVAFLSNPYYALPFELVQGITHAACFAACCSYMSRVSKPELKASTQGVMQGLHNGIGRACGALLGGYMINAIGSRASFCIYGLLSGCVLAGLLYIRRKVSLEEEDVRMDDNENLGDFGAPQGVPSTIPGKMV